jgi:hypothetical protein
MTTTSGSPSADADSVPESLASALTAPDPRAEWAAQRARLGGYPDPVTFTAAQQAVLNAAADQIIPPGGGFPAPSEVEVIEFVARYVTPASEPVKYYPQAAEHEFKGQLDALGEAFAAAQPSEQVASLQALENGDEAQQAFFEQLKSLVYHGYYARPEVTAAIRTNLPAGRDYHGPPQPYGYVKITELWPDREFPRNGSYIATEDVRPVAVPDDIAAEYGVQS